MVLREEVGIAEPTSRGDGINRTLDRLAAEQESDPGQVHAPLDDGTIIAAFGRQIEGVHSPALRIAQRPGCPRHRSRLVEQIERNRRRERRSCLHRMAGGARDAFAQNRSIGAQPQWAK